MRVVMLAAGYGTRLYPLTRTIPKPLIPINGRPILNFLFHKVNKACPGLKAKDVVIVSNNRFYKDFVAWKKKYNIKAEVVNDGSNTPEDRLGAVKDMAFAIGNRRQDVLVLGGDNLFEDDLKEFIRFARAKKPYASIAVYDLKSRSKAARYGTVKIDPPGKIISFQEKAKNPASTLAASCLYFFPGATLKFLKEYMAATKTHDASGKYIAWLARKIPVYAYPLAGKWLDVGHYDSLKEAEKAFSAK